jgi:hypothetical protein
MSGRDPSSTIGRAAIVDGSGAHQPLFQCGLSQSMLQNESRGYASAWTRSNRHNPLASFRLGRGEGSRARKKKESLCEEES